MQLMSKILAAFNKETLKENSVIGEDTIGVADDL